MTIVDVAAALEAGCVPTNAQAERLLQSALSSKALQTQLLSPSGSTLVADCRQFIETLGNILRDRNGKEELQEFWWKSRGAFMHQAGGGGEDGKVEVGEGQGALAETCKDTKGRRSKEEKKQRKKQEKPKVSRRVKSESEQAFKHLRTLARLLLVQPELRHIISDGALLLAEVLQRTTGTSLEEARATMGQVKSATGTFQNVAFRALAQAKVGKAAAAAAADTADQAREETRALKSGLLGRVTDAAGKKVDASGVPALQALREQLKEYRGAQKMTSVADIRGELSNAESVPSLDALQASLLRVAAEVASTPAQLESMKQDVSNGKIPTDLQKALLGSPGEQGSIDPTDLVDAAQLIAVASRKARLTDRQKVEEMIKGTGIAAKQNLQAAWTPERKERLVRRLRKLVVDCQSNQDYKDALIWFIERAETLVRATQQNFERPSSTLDDALADATRPLIQLLENFAGGRSLRDILSLARKLSLGAKDDPAIRQVWRDADKLLKRSLLQEGYALEPACEEAWRALAARFDKLNQQYKEELARLVGQVADFAAALASDELLHQLSVHLKNIVKDVSFGRDGSMLPSKALWQDLRLTILPAIFDKIGVLPVPRVKYTHPDFDLVIENIALELKNLLPSMLGIRMLNDVQFDFEKLKSSSHSHSVKIKIKGMSIRVHKLAFALELHKGLPFHDKGIADLLVGDFGVSIYIDVPKDPGPHYFKVKKVKAKLKTLRIKVHQSNHRILHAFADSIVNSYLTKRILRHFIGMGITIGLKQLDVALMALRLEREEEAGRMDLAEVRKRIAELRDLLRKYNEQAGHLEIDFKREEDPNDEKRWQEAHAVKWIKQQVDTTGKRNVVTNEWRSSAFDRLGEETVQPAVSKQAILAVENAAEGSISQAGQVEETEEEATVAQKPEGATTKGTVEKAQEELESVRMEERQARREANDPESMSSRAGAQAVKTQSKTSDQVQQLEKTVEQHDAL
ncbi:hypothetical protein IE81DRAFT_321529 [Ceraceosorus guamensis]|uniref:HAM1-like N-terminal domain-containing protein n=1 Tax=Ceraceosorus guamensis TaxID=1522189 RepID=A0A316W2X1_9BASI|nr:hypothetical protein IE81DRAFT_321529 [Ceraceosorus guamensis]PWN44130.1 hypothetical protein IE81DRAFT_321529 [Ceraceosorus guamensis]